MKIFKIVVALSGVGLIVLALITGKIRTIPEPISELKLEASEENNVSRAVDYMYLVDNFEGQIYLSYCGVASSVIVGKSLGLEINQNDFFKSNLAMLKTYYSGMTLLELSQYLAAHNMTVNLQYSGEFSGIADFRETLKTNLYEEGNYILINYSRKVLKQIGAGHISPVADYNEKRDEFLILDVADYKYGPTWISAESLFNAINSTDTLTGLKRGIVEVSLY